MSATSPRGAARLAGEAAVIFVSVVLALVADDWRENRNDRREEAHGAPSLRSPVRRPAAR